MTQAVHVHTARDTVTALLLAAALLLGGMLIATQVTESPLVRQSKIIRTIFSDSDERIGVTNFLTDARSREVLLKFAEAMANAYVSFELIPINEADTFVAVYESMGPVVEIESFAYHRKNLIIAGYSPDETGYREFLRRLRQKNYFEGVTGHFYTDTDDRIRFEIECVAME